MVVISKYSYYVKSDYEIESVTINPSALNVYLSFRVILSLKC